MDITPHLPPPMQEIIRAMKRLPGIGTRAATRYCFEMLAWSPNQKKEFIQKLDAGFAETVACSRCGCWLERGESCKMCDDQFKTTLCIVAWPRQVYSIRATHAVDAAFHVMGGVIDPLGGVEIDNLNLPALLDRLRQCQFHEIILAFDTTLEGDATSCALVEELSDHFPGVEEIIKRPSYGLPINSSIDFIDTATLTQAFQARSRS